MATTFPIQTDAVTDGAPGFYRVALSAVALSSFAALLLELSLTRLFSVVLFYHFAFLAISVALLGLGAGGVLAYLAKAWLQKWETRRFAALLCLLQATLIPLMLMVVLHVPVSLELSRKNFLHLSAIYLVSAVPFTVTGLLFSLVFARHPEYISRLYAADLAGGAAACLLLIPVLNWMGGPNAVLFAAFLSTLAAVLWGTGNLRQAALAAGLALLALLAANHSGRWFDVIYAKGIFRDRSWVEFARWNAISRVEVDRQGNAKAIVIDADASTYIMNADLKQWPGSEWERDLMAAPPALANILRPHGQFAIIGPGGGVDVLRAVANGSPSVTGIEINPIIANDIMRGRYADYSYHLYQRPEVHLHVTDGRSFIRSTAQHFDVVQMTLVDTWASTAAGAFALSENNLYTTEAFEEYFQHLNPDGLIAITRWEFRQPREALRIVSVAMEALHHLGVNDPARHIIVVSAGELNEDGIPVVVLAKKSPFTAAEENVVNAHLARYPKLTTLYMPSDPHLNPFSKLIGSNDPQGFSRAYAYDVSPVYDNAPFFFFTLKAREFLKAAAFAHAIDWKVNLGVAILAGLLAVSCAAVLLFLIGPMLLRGRVPGRRSVRLFYFVAIGLGYVLVEIALIQRFVLFLGHPTYALTVVVFLLLLSSGVGSLLSRELRQALPSRMVLLLIPALIFCLVAALQPLLQALVGLSLPAKLAICGLLLVPLGLLMGIPFPNGLRALVPEDNPLEHNLIEWAWAMNAASTVLGSVLAMVLAIAFGLNLTLFGGALAYLAAFALLSTLRTPRTTPVG